MASPSDLVLLEAWRLGDRAGDGFRERCVVKHAGTQIADEIATVPGVMEVDRIRIRRAGNRYFADVSVGMSRRVTFQRSEQVVGAVSGNLEAWRRLRLRPRVLVDVSVVSTATTVLGTPVSMPVLVAPTAIQRLAHPDGEEGMARAAAAAGTLMCLSTLATATPADVAAAAPDAPRWFQLYVFRDRGYRPSGGEAHDGPGVASWQNRTDDLFEALFPAGPD